MYCAYNDPMHPDVSNELIIVFILFIGLCELFAFVGPLGVWVDQCLRRTDYSLVGLGHRRVWSAR